jgi:hypothetical protein
MTPRGGLGATRIPESVLNAARIAGGHSIDLIDEDFCALEVTFGDEAYKIVIQWITATLDGEPRLRFAFSPPINIFGTALCPPNVLGGYILWEASSIAHHYAQLNEDAFSDIFPHHPVNPIPGPLAGPAGNFHVLHPRIALHALYARIQNPMDPNYPVLSGLPTGSYIITVITRCANVNFTVAIHKN